MNQDEQTNNQEESVPKWAYTSGNLVEEGNQSQPTEPPLPTAADEVLLSWTASEFVEHDKDKNWYAMLAGAAILVAAIIYIFTRQVFSVIVVILMAIAFGMYGSAKPRVLDYAITPQGIQIGNNVYPFATIKSFSVIDDGGMPYIQILFQKRLSVPAAVYVAPDQISQVADTIGQFVPYDQKKRDIADKISTRIRF